jgi:hypothetical protein
MHVPTSHNMHGVFEPSDLVRMWKELKRGDVAGESKAERALRAAAILRRRMMPNISPLTTTRKTKKSPPLLRRAIGGE